MNDLTDKIDFDKECCNLLIKGTARTGKTYLAISAAKKLLRLNIPVTVVSTCFSPRRDGDEYKPLFLSNNANFWHQTNGIAVPDRNLLSGVCLFYPWNSLQLDPSEAISCIRSRIEYFDKSFILVDEIHNIDPEIRIFLDRVLANGAKEGVHSIHVSQIAEYTHKDFNRELLCDRRSMGFNELDVIARNKAWGFED